MRRRGNPLLGLLIMPLFLIAGIFLARHGSKVLDNAKQSIAWPTTQGVIVNSEVVRERNRNSSSSGSSVTYTADVMFEFQLDGQTYSSNNVSFGQYSSSSASDARKIVRAYPANSRVTVYYNPDNPDESVLEPGVSAGSYMILGMGILFSAIGVLGFFGCLIAVLR